MKSLLYIFILLNFLFLSCDDSSQDNNNNNIHVVVCGDRVVEGDEECDGTDLKGFSCESLGFYGGELSCDDECKYVLDDCKNYGICGDGKLDEEEECDSFELNGKTCADFGYYDGILACSNKCKYAFGNCEVFGWCGNNSVEYPPEDCDGSLPEDITCESLGYYRGTVSCGDDCKINSELCEKCGDEIIQSSDGETCDGSNLGDNQCSDIGMLGSHLSCNYMCQIDYTGCEYYYRFGTPSSDSGIAAVMDSDGDFYVAFSGDGTMFEGEIDFPSPGNLYVARLDHYGRYKWIKKVYWATGTIVDSGSWFMAPVLTKDNNVIFPYCIGNCPLSNGYTNNFGKYTKDGTLLWESNALKSVVVEDASGFLYSGTTEEVGNYDPAHRDLFLRKFTIDGTLVWETTLTSPDNNLTFFRNLLYCDGNIYVAMDYDYNRYHVTNSISTHKLSITKYDLSGNMQWLYHFIDIDCRYWAGDGQYSSIHKMQCVPGEGILFAGQMWEPRYAPPYARQIGGTGAVNNNFLGKLSFDGSLIWAVFYYDLIAWIFDIKTDVDGNIFVAGDYDFWDSYGSGLFIIKFDANGNLIWNRTWISPQSNLHAIENLDIDENQNLFMFALVSEPFGDATPVASPYSSDLILMQIQGDP